MGILAWARKLWGLVLLVSAGYLWGQRGRRWSWAWKVGTVTCIVLALLALAVLAGILR